MRPLCSLRRGTLVAGHAGEEGVGHNALVLSCLLGVGHDPHNGHHHAAATARRRDEGEEDEGSKGSVDLTKENAKSFLAGIGTRSLEASTGLTSSTLNGFENSLKTSLLLQRKLSDIKFVGRSLAGHHREEGVAEEGSGSEDREAKVDEHAGGVEELGEAGGIAAAGDAVKNAASNHNDEHTPEVDPHVGLNNDEDDELDEVLGDEATKDGGVDQVAAAGAPPALASLLGNGVDTTFTALELNVLDLFDR